MGKRERKLQSDSKGFLWVSLRGEVKHRSGGEGGHILRKAISYGR